MLIMKEQIEMVKCFVLGWANRLFDCTIVRLVNIVERLMDVPQRTKTENIKLFVAVALLAAYVVGTIALVVWLPKQVFRLMLSMVESLH